MGNVGFQLKLEFSEVRMRYRFISPQLLKLPLGLVTSQVILACCSWVMLWREELRAQVKVFRCARWLCWAPASISRWIESLLLTAACWGLALGALRSCRVLVEAPPDVLLGFPHCWLYHEPSIGALHVPALLPLKLYSSTELSQQILLEN